MLHNLWAYQSQSQCRSRSQSTARTGASAWASMEIGIRLLVAGRDHLRSGSFLACHAPQISLTPCWAVYTHNNTHTCVWVVATGRGGEVRQHILRVLFMAAAVPHPTPNLPPISGHELCCIGLRSCRCLASIRCPPHTAYPYPSVSLLYFSFFPECHAY